MEKKEWKKKERYLLKTIKIEKCATLEKESSREKAELLFTKKR